MPSLGQLHALQDDWWNSNYLYQDDCICSLNGDTVRVSYREVSDEKHDFYASRHSKTKSFISLLILKYFTSEWYLRSWHYDHTNHYNRDNRNNCIYMQSHVLFVVATLSTSLYILLSTLLYIYHCTSCTTRCCIQVIKWSLHCSIN